jgi:hypothetical protein
MATWQHLRSSTANKRPTTSLADGRIAINTNTASPGLFFKDSAGTGIVKVGPVHVGTTAPNSVPASGGSSGNYTGEQWLDTSVSPAQMKVWNGSTWVGIVADELPVSKLQDGAARQLIQTDAAGTGVEWTSSIDLPGTLDVTGASTLDSTLSVAGVATFATGSAGSPSLTFTGDANSGVYSPGADQVAISTNGTGRLFVDSSGNIGINTTPSSLGSSVTTLEIKGGSTTRTGGLRISSSDSSAKGAFYIYDGAGVLGTETSHPLGFYIANSERMRLDSSGRLGLGTSSPSTTLSVAGGISGTAGMNISGAGWGVLPYVANSLVIDNNAGEARFFATGANATTRGSFIFYNGETDGGAGAAMVIDTSSRVGIGTASPGVKVDIVSDNNTTLASVLRVNSNNVAVNTSLAYDGLIGSGQLTVQAGTSSALIFGSNAAERARIDSSGRLLVGTSTAPSTGQGQYSKLVVQGNTSGAGGGYFAIQRTSASTLVDDVEGVLSFNDNSGNTFAQIICATDGTPGTNDYPGRLVFSTTADGASSPTERMRISADGLTRTYGDGDSIIAATGQAAGTTFGVFVGRHSATSTTTGTNSFIVYTNGNVVNTNNSYGAISDIKLKENIVDATPQWNDIKALQVRKYNFKEGQTHTQIGLVAQEVELVSPGLVSESPDRDEDGNDLGTVTKSVNYSVLYMKAVKALQEAMERIETLEAKVAALEGV